MTLHPASLSRKSFLHLGAGVTGALAAASALPPSAAAPSAPVDGGRTPRTVTWDDRSFFVDGERILLFSGEIHHWRVPAPAQWRELLQLLRASGFNAVSF